MIRFPRVRLLEFCILGHGPLWLDYYATALAPHCRELSLEYPDVPAYRSLQDAAERWAEAGDVGIRLEPFAIGDRTRIDDDEVLSKACAPGADLCLITFLDLLIHQHQDLPEPGADARPALWGVWFSPADPSRRLRHLVRRVFSKRARRDLASLAFQRQVPEWLAGAFFTDPSMAARANMAGKQWILPDPWPTRPRHDQREARNSLGLPQDAKLFFHFGVAHKRKGLDDAIGAWPKLPEGAVLLRAGALRDEQRTAMRKLESAGKAIVHERFVPDDEVDLYYRAADWILLPYRAHEGSSGILSAAAAAQRPVVAADYGVVGRRVRAEALGELHARGSSSSLAAAVCRALDQPIDRYAAALDAFADAHTTEAFYDAFRAPWIS